MGPLIFRTTSIAGSIKFWSVWREQKWCVQWLGFALEEKECALLLDWSADVVVVAIRGQAGEGSTQGGRASCRARIPAPRECLTAPSTQTLLERETNWHLVEDTIIWDLWQHWITRVMETGQTDLEVELGEWSSHKRQKRNHTGWVLQDGLCSSSLTRVTHFHSHNHLMRYNWFCFTLGEETDIQTE